MGEPRANKPRTHQLEPEGPKTRPRAPTVAHKGQYGSLAVFELRGERALTGSQIEQLELLRAPVRMGMHQREACG